MSEHLNFWSFEHLNLWTFKLKTILSAVKHCDFVMHTILPVFAIYLILYPHPHKYYNATSELSMHTNVIFYHAKILQCCAMIRFVDTQWQLLWKYKLNTHTNDWDKQRQKTTSQIKSSMGLGSHGRSRVCLMCIWPINLYQDKVLDQFYLFSSRLGPTVFTDERLVCSISYC